jgi:hypothetical protein
MANRGDCLSPRLNKKGMKAGVSVCAGRPFSMCQLVGKAPGYFSALSSFPDLSSLLWSPMMLFAGHTLKTGQLLQPDTIAMGQMVMFFSLRISWLKARFKSEPFLVFCHYFVRFPGNAGFRSVCHILKVMAASSW